MTDKEILDHVYRKLLAGRVHGSRFVIDAQEMIDFIQTEWQEQDKQSYSETVPSFSKSWYMDAKEMERHRGLEIGEDGTVKDIQ